MPRGKGGMILELKFIPSIKALIPFNDKMSPKEQWLSSLED